MSNVIHLERKKCLNLWRHQVINGYAEMLFLPDHAITLTFIFLHASCLICNYIFIICFSFLSFFLGGGGAVNIIIICWFSNYSWEIYEILATYWFYYEWLSVVKRCESVNTMASFLWWIVGFYWVVSGGDTLLRDAPRLYWYALTTLECPLFISICYMLYYFEIRARAHTHTHIYSFPFLLLPSCKVGRGRSL